MSCVPSILHIGEKGDATAGNTTLQCFVQADEDPLTASRGMEHAVHYHVSTVLILSTHCTRGGHDDESAFISVLRYIEPQKFLIYQNLRHLHLITFGIFRSHSFLGRVASQYARNGKAGKRCKL
jgi:hypothetical protein